MARKSMAVRLSPKKGASKKAVAAAEKKSLPDTECLGVVLSSRWDNDYLLKVVSSDPSQLNLFT